MSAKSYRTAAIALAASACCTGALAAPSEEARSLNELRNTVVNLLQGLVEKGVLTRDQAQAMVETAQKKAADDAAAADAATAAQEKADAGAVRVPYVPEIVREQIRKEIMAELGPQVTKDVVEQAKSEQWGVPGALPEWVQRVRWYGDVRVRGQGDMFADENLPNSYLDVLTVNDRGGIGRAQLAALANTTEDRQRLRARLRVGLEAELGYGWSLGARLTTGTLRDAVSTNQTLGTYAGRYTTGFDLGYLKWYHNSATGRHVVNAWGGRIPNPWLSTDLVWDPDLTFEGVAANYRFGLMRDDPYSHYAFLTLGAFPLQEVELSTKDKWLYGGQLGFEWKFTGGSRLRFGAAYYQYDNIKGVDNILDGNLNDFTAPQWVQKGNSLIDIRNDADTSTQLLALAADYHIANATLNFDYRVSPGYRVALSADYAKNIGFKDEDVLALNAKCLTVFCYRIAHTDKARTNGYETELNFGSVQMDHGGAWRTYFGYRYVEADAVLDAFTDSDFHLGGTDAKGFFVGGDFAFSSHVFARLKYFSANEIDGPPLGIDLWQLDINASF